MTEADIVGMRIEDSEQEALRRFHTAELRANRRFRGIVWGLLAVACAGIWGYILFSILR